MLTIVKPVYYCEHCKRHRMTAAAILRHEPRCIYNPRRDACGWHRDMRPLAPADLLSVCLRGDDVSGSLLVGCALSAAAAFSSHYRRCICPR